MIILSLYVTYRREMKSFGVGVHLVEPGFFRTPMNHPDRLRGILQRKWDKLTPELQQEYGEDFLGGCKCSRKISNR